MGSLASRRVPSLLDLYIRSSHERDSRAVTPCFRLRRAPCRADCRLVKRATPAVRPAPRRRAGSDHGRAAGRLRLLSTRAARQDDDAAPPQTKRQPMSSRRSTVHQSSRAAARPDRAATAVLRRCCASALLRCRNAPSLRAGGWREARRRRSRSSSTSSACLSRDRRSRRRCGPDREPTAMLTSAFASAPLISRERRRRSHVACTARRGPQRPPRAGASAAHTATAVVVRPAGSRPALKCSFSDVAPDAEPVTPLARAWHRSGRFPAAIRTACPGGAGTSGVFESEPRPDVPLLLCSTFRALTIRWAGRAGEASSRRRTGTTTLDASRRPRPGAGRRPCRFVVARSLVSALPSPSAAGARARRLADQAGAASSFRSRAGGTTDILARALAPELGKALRPDLHRRQQARRRRQHRRRHRRQVAARRLHAADGNGRHARDQSVAVSEDAVRPGQGLRADHARRRRAERAGDEPGEGRGVRESPTCADLIALRKRQPGQAQHGVERQRHVDPPRPASCSRR